MLEKLEKELQRQEAMVEHIRGLLARADEKRLTEIHETRKWNKVLDNLESALDEAKARVQKCERELRRERERLGYGQAVAPAVSPVVVTHENASLMAEPAPLAAHTHQEEAAAARAMLETPLESVELAPLEQVAMAQHYLLWRKDQGLVNGDDKRLEGRIELAIQGGAGMAPEASGDQAEQDRRNQHALRAIVDKVLSNQSDALTVRELELAIDCYSILARRPSLGDSESRLKRILGRVVMLASQLGEDVKRKVELVT